MKEKLKHLYEMSEKYDIDLDDFFSINLAKYDELVRLMGWADPNVMTKYALQGFNFEVTTQGWLVAIKDKIEITLQIKTN